MEVIRTDDRHSRTVFKRTLDDGTVELFMAFPPPLTYLDPKLIDTMEVERINGRFTTYNGPCRVIKISPATPSDLIAQSRELEFGFESYDEYMEKVYPLITKQKCTWIENIFSGEAESDSILYQDEEVVVLPDIYWVPQKVETLNCLLISTDSTLRSIRDLTAEHIPLLKRMQKVAAETVTKNFGVPENKLRFYFHYHPSWWWLHVHVTHIDLNYGYEDRNHCIFNVINNLEIDSDYYKKVRLRIYKREWTSLDSKEKKAVASSAN